MVKYYEVAGASASEVCRTPRRRASKLRTDGRNRASGRRGGARSLVGRAAHVGLNWSEHLAGGTDDLQDIQDAVNRT